MATRTFDVIEVLMHWHAGRSLLGMSESLGVDRKTIRKVNRGGGGRDHT